MSLPSAVGTNTTPRRFTLKPSCGDEPVGLFEPSRWHSSSRSCCTIVGEVLAATTPPDPNSDRDVHAVGKSAVDSHLVAVAGEPAACRSRSARGKYDLDELPHASHRLVCGLAEKALSGE